MTEEKEIREAFRVKKIARIKQLTFTSSLAIFIVIVIIIGKNILEPNYVPLFECDYIVDMSSSEFYTGTDTIRGLIAGKNLGTTRLDSILYHTDLPDVLAYDETDHEFYFVRPKICYEGSEPVFHLLQNSFESLQHNKIFRARYYLRLAKICWDNPIICG